MCGGRSEVEFIASKARSYRHRFCWGLVLAGCLVAVMSGTHAQQDNVANARNTQAETVHPSVLLERRIQDLVIELDITGEQEPPFRVVMAAVAELELAYSQGLRTDIATPAALQQMKEQLLSPVLYGHQIARFREVELLRMQQQRPQAR